MILSEANKTSSLFDENVLPGNVVTILQELEGWLCLQYVQVGPECFVNKADVVVRLWKFGNASVTFG